LQYWGLLILLAQIVQQAMKFFVLSGPHDFPLDVLEGFVQSILAGSGQTLFVHAPPMTIDGTTKSWGPAKLMAHGDLLLVRKTHPMA
jgi:hypothetical protein